MKREFRNLHSCFGLVEPFASIGHTLMEAPGSFVDHILYVPAYSSHFNHEELVNFGTFINLVCRPVTN